MRAVERATKILDGIDRDEMDSDGWWETSTGAAFGKAKLDELRAALSEDVTLGEAALRLLDTLLPAEVAEERIGWLRGAGLLNGDASVVMGCEFCHAEHEDMSMNEHKPDCPVTIGRALLAQWRAL